MRNEPRRFKISRNTSEWIVAAIVVGASILFAELGVWVFRPGAEATDRPIANAILSDRATLGFVQMLVTAAALYGLASIAVLVMRGRWLRSISTTGREADQASDSDNMVDELEHRLGRALEEREEARQLLWRYLRG